VAISWFVTVPAINASHVVLRVVVAKPDEN